MKDTPTLTVETKLTLETKPFYCTSEFWGTLLMSLFTFAQQVAGVLPAKYSTIVLGGLSAAYALARGIAKSGNPPMPIQK